MSVSSVYLFDKICLFVEMRRRRRPRRGNKKTPCLPQETKRLKNTLRYHSSCRLPCGTRPLTPAVTGRCSNGHHTSTLTRVVFQQEAPRGYSPAHPHRLAPNGGSLCGMTQGTRPDLRQMFSYRFIISRFPRLSTWKISREAHALPTHPRGGQPASSASGFVRIQ